MPHPQMYIKKLGFLQAQKILLSDAMRPKYIIQGDYQNPKIYPPTNLEAARKAHQEHIKNMSKPYDPNEELQQDTQEDIRYMESAEEHESKPSAGDEVETNPKIASVA